ncbi:aminotransferase class IV [Deltaproteobacteria bacterium TL4]
MNPLSVKPTQTTVMSMELCFNGTFYPDDQAVFCGNDRGLLMGDGLFETLRICQQSPIQTEEHWLRFRNSAEVLKIDLWFSFKTLNGWIQELLRKNQIQEGYLRWTLTRGIRQIGGLNLSSQGKANLVVEARPISIQPSQWKLSLATTRRSSTSKITSHKTLNYLENLISLDEAQQRGFDEALFCVEKEQVQEGTRSNVFMIKNEELWTPPLALAVLPGITRQTLLNAYQRSGTVHEKPFSWEALQGADEVFMTNSLWGIIPVSCFETQAYHAHPVTHKLMEQYQLKLLKP